MIDTAGLWIGAEEERRGPYTEATLRRWVNDGVLDANTLAWRDGMIYGLPLTTLLEQLRAAPSASVPPSSSAAYAAPTAESMGTHAAATRRTKRESLAQPPSLHWGLVLLFSVLSLGIFLIVWNFKQSAWVRKIDEDSRATAILIASIVGYSVGGMIQDGGEMTGFGLIVMLASLALYYAAYVSMGISMRRKLPEYGVVPQIGMVTLLLFNVFYLQAQMTWVARWKASGQTLPPAPKRTMYVLLVFPLALVVGAAISLPAYQQYVFRTQVMEGAVFAEQLMDAANDYYARHGELPNSNGVLGVKAGAVLSGRFVSDARMREGHVVISYNNPATAESLRDKVLVLTPKLSDGQLTWDCTSNSTLPDALLPPQCLE